ncbi:1,4-dihydroxy-2-naphthoate polyprenyltransferase [Texcoconibacillus texcoconensis]|uniref:1,4-dihydroxy-2-naphthoate octaprenyltransferase n=1 Tax=Texcoconibacillus texcoconensis TaxID=1095777 RepID=A0A840QQU8_9BACI|nr:1,4-dihydroxy-2-naphthoate polyprenyltransferase [Texcoconibacillus texcoconensis]MBB5173730.1 1,4-dihydroxy-2-naphthoate octaprenyltransferase [Texcoconibacillus texcoconensis]
MTISTFLKLVEIKTKIASLFPFLIGLLFVIYRFEAFQPVNTLIFFMSMFLFDLTTTAINNYMDYRKATNAEYKTKRNIIGQKAIPERVVVTTIYTLLTSAALLGIWLTVRTDLLVLLIGLVCFAIGIFYTFGPIPLSRMPLGEVFSGGAMGFGIIFLIIYVNAFDQGIAQITWASQMVHFQVDLFLMFEILLISLPCVFTIANLMLANNICDLEEDISNHRYTLPFYLGKKRSITLFNILYIASFLSIVTAVFLNILPLAMLFTFIVIYPVYKHVRLFNRKQTKEETFEVAVKNLVIVNGSSVSLLIVAVLI